MASQGLEKPQSGMWWAMTRNCSFIQNNSQFENIFGSHHKNPYFLLWHLNLNLRYSDKNKHKFYCFLLLTTKIRNCIKFAFFYFYYLVKARVTSIVSSLINTVTKSIVFTLLYSASQLQILVQYSGFKPKLSGISKLKNLSRTWQFWNSN